MCRKTLLVLFLFHYLFSCGQIYVNDSFTSNAFPICSPRGTSSIIVSPNEELSVKKTVGLFAEDLFRVTHTRAEIYTSKKYKGKEVIVIGTIGKNPFIDKLISKGKIDVSAIKNGWEQYIIQTVEKPQQGVDKALIVVGSDKRGTAYGLLSISEAMGVSPYYWWADVPVRHLSEVYLSGSIISKKPSVKYRGIFINDEDWGLKPWSSNNFEKELGDIGPKTYSKVCELILRLRGNMLAPAMHSCTGAFYSHPESKLVADSFGIIITTSHCEPLLLNNAAKSEWDIKRDGDWNYATNKSTIQKKWNDRLDEASRFENLYTMAMRGLHDAGLRGNLPMNEKVNLLNQVIIDQRQMLCQHIGKNILDIPQIFIPYKETMAVYENGLKVPDDVTLVWVDDNYGYMKRVSNPEEQKRKGRSGVYYHMSYLGNPHDYLWLNTTPPVLMYEALKKAYDTGADRYWLLNVGDIKPSELGMKTFFDLAWNINGYDYTKVNSHQGSFLTGIFGEKYSHSFQDILNQYYRLAWSRKPECMGWEYEWDDSAHTGLKDTKYSFENYSEAQQRLRDYDNISNRVKGVLDQLDPSFRPAFFEMLAYPVMASYQMNRKFLMAQLNHEQYKTNQFANANWAAKQMELAYDSVASLNHEYNTMLNGKWNGMMSLAPGLCALYQEKPKVTYTEGKGESPVDLSAHEVHLEGCYLVDLSQISRKVENNGHKFTLIDGMGYDWKVIQLGQPTDDVADAGNMNGDRIEYTLPKIDKDSVSVILYTVPFFPLYAGRSTSIGISLDNTKPTVYCNKFKEFGSSWKDQVVRNGAVTKITFSIDKTRSSHTLSFICGDPGMMIEKVIIDWGGLKQSYNCFLRD